MCCSRFMMHVSSSAQGAWLIKDGHAVDGVGCTSSSIKLAKGSRARRLRQCSVFECMRGTLTKLRFVSFLHGFLVSSTLVPARCFSPFPAAT